MNECKCNSFSSVIKSNRQRQSCHFKRGFFSPDSEKVVAWFSNYLNNRTQYIKYDGLFSEHTTVNKGVMQGSVLGPLLLIFISMIWV